MEKLEGRQTVAKLQVKINEIVDFVNDVQALSNLVWLVNRIHAIEQTNDVLGLVQRIKKKKKTTIATEGGVNDTNT